MYGAAILFKQIKIGQLRMCIDYCSLNWQMRLNMFPILCIANLVDRLGKAMVFRLINLSYAYYQVCICKVDKPKNCISHALGFIREPDQWCFHH